MPLKRMSEFKRDDYVYESPDGDQYEITIVQTADRKYVEIKKDDDQIQWDVEMLLDIADAVRAAIHKPIKKKPHHLRSPNIIDHREKTDNATPSDMIQASVEESMEAMESAPTTVAPVQSFSPGTPGQRDLAAELEGRKTMERGVVDPEKIIAPSGIKR